MIHNPINTATAVPVTHDLDALLDEHARIVAEIEKGVDESDSLHFAGAAKADVMAVEKRVDGLHNDLTAVQTAILELPASSVTQMNRKVRAVAFHVAHAITENPMGDNVSLINKMVSIDLTHETPEAKFNRLVAELQATVQIMDPRITSLTLHGVPGADNHAGFILAGHPHLFDFQGDGDYVRHSETPGTGYFQIRQCVDGYEVRCGTADIHVADEAAGEEPSPWRKKTADELKYWRVERVA